jgi:hypothetical protein
MYTLIQTAMLNGVDPQAWLADVLRRFFSQSRTWAGRARRPGGRSLTISSNVARERGGWAKQIAGRRSWSKVICSCVSGNLAGL